MKVTKYIDPGVEMQTRTKVPLLLSLDQWAELINAIHDARFDRTQEYKELQQFVTEEARKHRIIPDHCDDLGRLKGSGGYDPSRFDTWKY